MHHTVNALVLREVAYKESDKVLTLLAEDLGKITATARGSRKKGSLLTAPTQLLCWSEVVIYDFRGRWLVQEGTVVRQFSGITADLERLALACYCGEVVELLAVEGLPSGELLQLLLNTLHVLDRQQGRPLALVKAVFELRAMTLSGYAPSLEGCAICGDSPRSPQFHLGAGLLHCGGCRSQVGQGISLPLTEGARRAMCHICGDRGGRIFAFTVDDGSLDCLSQVAEGYLLSQLERGFRTLDFYKTVKQ